MAKSNYEIVKKHLKGFRQGFLFVLVMVIIILFFHLIGYVDKSISPNEYDNSEIELWNEEIELSEDIMDSGVIGSPKMKMYEEQHKSDFGSKSLNQKDREAAEQAKKEKIKGKL